jgi:hypothetical protein
MEKSIKAISEQITWLEAERDHIPEDFTTEHEEMLNVLYLCYDLLARTSAIEKLEVPTPPEMFDHDGNDSEMMPVYGQMQDAFTDFVFALATKQGKISLRDLLCRFISTQKEAAESIGKRRQTIGDYLNNKSSFNCDSYEEILNYYIEKK